MTNLAREARKKFMQSQQQAPQDKTRLDALNDVSTTKTKVSRPSSGKICTCSNLEPWVTVCNCDASLGAPSVQEISKPLNSVQPQAVNRSTKAGEARKKFMQNSKGEM